MHAGWILSGISESKQILSKERNANTILLNSDWGIVKILFYAKSQQLSHMSFKKKSLNSELRNTVQTKADKNKFYKIMNLTF